LKNNKKKKDKREVVVKDSFTTGEKKFTSLKFSRWCHVVLDETGWKRKKVTWGEESDGDLNAEQKRTCFG
jgi:hypothetical protein